MTMDKLKVLNRFLCGLALIMIMAAPGVVALAVGALLTLCEAMAAVLFGTVAMALCTVWCTCLAFPAVCTAVARSSSDAPFIDDAMLRPTSLL